ncbi:MAG: hypothetical protein EBY43_06095 [Opitutae bacterium]|nr:hypothetical protein [Opitutae bacterium]
MPYLASAGGYNLTPIAPLASVLQRGAARSRSNDATVALNNVLRDNFNAEKQMALNALTAMALGSSPIHNYGNGKKEHSQIFTLCPLPNCLN